MHNVLVNAVLEANGAPGSSGGVRRGTGLRLVLLLMSTVLALSACSRGESGEPGPGASPAHRSSANVPSAKAPSANVPSTAAPFTEVTAPLDDFYRAPAALPPTPGVLIREDGLQSVQQIPDGASARRILYTTTMPDGALTTAVATVLLPANPPAGPRPVVLWEHGTLGIEQKCMPSATAEPFKLIPAIAESLARGWVVVAPDYQPDSAGVHPYYIASGLARSGLDALRAVRQLDGVSIGRRAVVWGHSQGGQSALATAAFDSGYAPGVRLVGVAALAPLADMPMFLKARGSTEQGQQLAAFLITAYDRYFPDIRFSSVVPAEIADKVRAMAGLCPLDPGDAVELTALTRDLGETLVIGDPDLPALRRHLVANAPDGKVPVPVLIAQGSDDTLVLPTLTAQFVSARCAAGQVIDYRVVSGVDHGEIIEPDSPVTYPLVEWTADRFAGKPGVRECVTSTVY